MRYLYLTLNEMEKRKPPDLNKAVAFFIKNKERAKHAIIHDHGGNTRDNSQSFKSSLLLHAFATIS